jgi:hypothetical protein
MNEEVNPQTTTDQAVTPEVPQNESTEQVEVKTFTQDEVNSIAAKEAKKAQEKFLKSLGFDNFSNVKEGIAKYKEWQDSQKTEAEKQTEQLQKLQNDYTMTSDENATLKAQITAMQAGVNSDYVSDVVTLAKSLVNDEMDINQAIEKVVEKYPHFKQQQEAMEEKKPTFTTGQHSKSTSEGDSFVSALLGKK